MRSFILAFAAAAVLATVPSAARAAPSGGQHLYETPWSVGLELGFVIVDEFALFNMQIPFEYTFKVGPGELAPHFAFMLSARKNVVAISLPLGARYKIKVLPNHPLYVWPLLDIGPNFDAKNGGTSGILMVGGGLSYLVHKHVELMFKPLALGAVFNADGGVFLYNLTLGANFRF